MRKKVGSKVRKSTDGWKGIRKVASAKGVRKGTDVRKIASAVSVADGREEYHYEVIVCEAFGTWASLFVLATSKFSVSKFMERALVEEGRERQILSDFVLPRKVVHIFIQEGNSGENWPDEDRFIDLTGAKVAVRDMKELGNL